MTAIMTSKSLYMLSLKNKDMFKMDSKNVTEVIRLCKGIAVELTNVTKEVAKILKLLLLLITHCKV